MIELSFAPSFLRQLKHLPVDLQEEVFEKTELFRDRTHHTALKVHKLKGKLKGRYSFSVNYSYRIVFSWTDSNEVAFLAVGDHDIYK